MTRTTLMALAFGVTVWVVAFHDLGGRNLHDTDTARWGQLAREMLRSDAWLVPTRYGELYVNKPPLYLWAVAGPAKVLGGVTPYLVRLPSALGLVLMVLMTAWWMRVRGGSRASGRIAGLLVLSTYFVAWLGRAGRLDMFGAGLSIAAAVMLDRAALGAGTRRTPWLAGLLVGACLLTKGPPLLLVPLAVLFVPAPGQPLRERLRAARPLLVLAVAAGTALLWFAPAVLQAGWDDYGHKLLVGQAAERIGGTIDQREAPWHYVVGLVSVGLPWGLAYLVLALGVWSPRVRRAVGPLAGLAMAGALVVVFFSLIPTKHMRYLAPVVPLFALPLAAWIERWLAGPKRAAWPRLARILAAVCALGAVGLVAVGLIVFAAPTFVSASAFAVLAWAAWSGAAGADPRRAFTLCLLFGLAYVMLAQAVLRPRIYETRKEQFNRRVAELRTGGTRVWLASGMTPEAVFHGAPDARFMAGTAVPREGDERVLVVTRRGAADALRDPRGRTGKILVSRSGAWGWVVVGFGYP